MKSLPLLFVFPVAAHAASIVTWDLDGQPGNNNGIAATTENADVSAGTLGYNTGLGAPNSWPDSMSVVQNNAAINSLATALANDEYFSFIITPDANIGVSYTTLNMNYSFGANTRPAETVYALLSSAGGFDESSVIATSNHAMTGGAFGTQSASYDLSGATELQNNDQAVEFRLYAYNIGANAMTRLAIGRAFSTDGANDVELIGETAVVPEPTTTALIIGVTALAALQVRRRSHKPDKC